MDTYLKIDDSEFCTLAICEACGWREITGAPATAWKELALHAKHAHDDPHACAQARHAMWWHKNRSVRGL